MNFWQFADANPVWVTLWLFLIVLALPASVSYKRGGKADPPS